MKPVIFGLEGEVLGAEERAFFRACEPAGYILFGRNIANDRADGRERLRALTDALRDIHGRDDLLVMTDQEGGRVARLGPPLWPAFPAASRFADLYEQAPSSALEACRLNAQAIATMLRAAGITVDAMPLLDVRQADASAIMGDRSFGADPMRVAALGRVALDGLAEGGVAGIVKHMPGHGRARVDSHEERPFVDADAAALESDLAPFRALRAAPFGMMAHIVYPAWDAERPASQSPTVIRTIVRERIGFEGLLMSDDLAMKALEGAEPDRAAAVVAAGCDLALHCHGTVAERAAVAERLPDMTAETRARLDRAMAFAAQPLADVPLEALTAQRDALLAVLA